MSARSAASPALVGRCRRPARAAAPRAACSKRSHTATRGPTPMNITAGSFVKATAIYPHADERVLPAVVRQKSCPFYDKEIRRCLYLSRCGIVPCA